jgi:hypothetical protein
MFKILALVGAVVASPHATEAATVSEEVGEGECFLRTSRTAAKGIEANFVSGDTVPYSSRKVGFLSPHLFPFFPPSFSFSFSFPFMLSCFLSHSPTCRFSRHI